jgi:hypothetical protein
LAELAWAQPSTAGVGQALAAAGPVGHPGPSVVGAQPLLQQFGYPLPDSSTLSFGYGADGLIESINGIPVNDYVQDLSKERNDIYRQMQRDRTRLPDGTRIEDHFNRRDTGRMHSVLFDRLTGGIFEADNRTLGHHLPTG